MDIVMQSPAKVIIQCYSWDRRLICSLDTLKCNNMVHPDYYYEIPAKGQSWVTKLLKSLTGMCL